MAVGFRVLQNRTLLVRGTNPRGLPEAAGAGGAPMKVQGRFVGSKGRDTAGPQDELEPGWTRVGILGQAFGFSLYPRLHG